jgi:hypothetical protein
VRKVLASFVLAAVLPLMAVINSDTFTGLDNTDIDSRSPDVGGNWDDTSTSDWEILSNKAASVTSVGWVFAVVDSSDASVLIEADIDIPSANDVVCALTTRFLDDNDYWIVDIIRQSGANYRMRIVDNQSGSETARDEDTDVGAIGGTTVNVTVTANGNTITGYLNDVQTVTYASASFQNTETKHGLGTYNAGFSMDCRWDNFVVNSDPTFGGGGGGATINPAQINMPIRGGGWLFSHLKDVLRVR